MSYCCPKCGKLLSVSDVKGYPFVCHSCDENFYQFEAVWKDEEEPEGDTGYVCPKCGNTKHFVAYNLLLRCDLFIEPDRCEWGGWTYDMYDLDEDDLLTCGNCGVELPAEEFWEE